MNVHQSLDDFVKRFVSQTKIEQRIVDLDMDWPSDCVVKGMVENRECWLWQPVIQSPKQSFDNLEQALQLRLHDDIKVFYTRFWSDNLSAVAKQGQCQLLQVWNTEDFSRLQENLIGHVLMKQRLNQPVTLFFGLTDEDDFILSMDNESGQVLLEQVGTQPNQVLAPDLATFISGLGVAELA